MICLGTIEEKDDRAVVGGVWNISNLQTIDECYGRT